MSPSHVSPAGLVTRQRRRFRSCSIDITAYHLAGTEHPDALTAAKDKGTFGKRRSPISLVAATPRRVRLALLGRDRRVGECLLLREERKSGLGGPISVFDPTQTLQLLRRGAPVHKTTIDAIDELAEKIWDLEGDLLEALSLP